MTIIRQRQSRPNCKELRGNGEIENAEAEKAQTTSAWQEIVVRKTSARYPDDEAPTSGCKNSARCRRVVFHDYSTKTPLGRGSANKQGGTASSRCPQNHAHDFLRV